MIREPVVVIGGHVDHGKTSLLDHIRGSFVAEREAGNITQHIGATDVPTSNIEKHSGELLKKYGFKLTIPGLLFIDTPGHEAFAALRSRGCSVADIAVLIIDIMQGVQPQTIEVLDYLKNNKTPFIVALTKVDRIKGFREDLSLNHILKEVDEGKTLFATQFEEKFYKILGQLSELGFSLDRYDRVKDFTKELLMIPVSSKTGHGISELLLFLSGLSQKYLDKKLEVSGKGKISVLETKDERGFGRTADVILYDGVLSKGDFVRVESDRGIAVTKVKHILRPKEMQEMRTTKDKFNNLDKVHAAAGLKIVLEDTQNISPGDILEVIDEKEAKTLETTIKCVKSNNCRGIVVKVDVDGSTDAINSLAEKEEVDIARVDVSDIVKEDVVEATLFRDQSFEYGAIFVFNRKVSLEVEEFAKRNGIKIFSSSVIYKIFEDYNKWREERAKEIETKELGKVKYPFKIRIIPQYIFRQSKPFVCGIEVLEGEVHEDTKVMQNGSIIGTLKKIQDKGKDVHIAKEKSEVAVSIEGTSLDKVDLEVPLYSFIPLRDRFVVKKYLEDKFPALIEELFEEYQKLE